MGDVETLATVVPAADAHHEDRFPTTINQLHLRDKPMLHEHVLDLIRVHHETVVPDTSADKARRSFRNREELVVLPEDWTPQAEPVNFADVDVNQVASEGCFYKVVQ